MVRKRPRSNNRASHQRRFTLSALSLALEVADALADYQRSVAERELARHKAALAPLP